MKYDCPPANRFGDDPPLWRSALSTFLPILETVVTGLEDRELTPERSEGVWSQIIDIFGAIVLADTSPESEDEDEDFVLPLLTRYHRAIASHVGGMSSRLVEIYAETLRKASILYRFDVGRAGGTTAPAIPERSERMRYWAFDALFSQASFHGSTEEGNSKAYNRLAIAKVVTASLLSRIRGSLRTYVADSRLRGSMPLGR